MNQISIVFVSIISRISEWFSHDVYVNQPSHNVLNDSTEPEVLASENLIKDTAKDELNHKESSLVNTVSYINL